MLLTLRGNGRADVKGSVAPYRPTHSLWGINVCAPKVMARTQIL
jgi:hypothetical protein